MADLDSLKKNWQVLDENLQKTKIITNEQIKKITMEKIQTTFETWRKKSKFSLITGILITLFFTVQWFLQGYVWQAASYFSIMLVLIVLSLMERKEMKSYNTYSLSTAKLLEKVENLQLRKQREKLFAIPIIAFMVFIITGIGDFKISTLVAFIAACITAFVFGYIRMRQNFSTLRKDIQELDELQKESNSQQTK